MRNDTKTLQRLYIQVEKDQESGEPPKVKEE